VKGKRRRKRYYYYPLEVCYKRGYKKEKTNGVGQPKQEKPKLNQKEKI